MRNQVVITKDVADLSEKARNLAFMERDLGLRVLFTVVVPEYRRNDVLPTDQLKDFDLFYVRLCFRGEHPPRRSGKVVAGHELGTYVSDLASLAESFPADLVVQPFIIANYSGGALKLGNLTYVESALGNAPNLFHRGRSAFRALFTEGKLLGFDCTDQGIDMVWEGTTVTHREESGWDKFDPQDTFLRLALRGVNAERVILEWCVWRNELIFLDIRHLPKVDSFSELSLSPPRFPNSITASLDQLKNRAMPTRILILDHPDLSALDSARSVEYVMVKQGARLSHLSVYSLFEEYKCVFLDGSTQINPGL